METQRQDETLTVTGLRELSVANARSFRNAILALLTSDLERIEIDLSQTQVVDAGGLGALLSLFQAARERRREGPVIIRILNPSPSVQQMLELTRLHHVFEITSSASRPELRQTI